MKHVELDGNRIAYDIIGDGPPLVFTPGGWAPGDSGPGHEYADILAKNFSVLIYDRRNSGSSDIIIEDAPSEFDMSSKYLHMLLQQLGCYPAYTAGCSGGAISSLSLAYSYPNDVKAM